MREQGNAGGLVGQNQEKVPLVGVAVEGEIACGHARVTVRQTYKNDGAKPIEAVYTFPLPADSTLSGFKMTAAGRTIDGEVKEREAAFAAYDDALTRGHGAALLEQERPNVFSASVGNILPSEEVVIEIEYIERLFAEEGSLRFMLPTLVAPRYVPGAPAGDRTAHGTIDPTDAVPDADRISPPRAATVPYALSLSLVVDMGANVALESPSHRIATSRVGEKARAELAGEPLDRDFVLLVTQAKAEESVSVACHREPEKQGYFALTIVPDLFELKEKSGPATCVFVLDRSGSMEGTSMKEARTALRLCLRQLREGDLFSIIAFDTAVERFSNVLVPFTSKTLAQADAWIDATDPRGGTELLAPLELAVQLAGDGIVILLTDGQVGNEDQIFKHVMAARKSARVYSFGIGTNVSTVLLGNLAAATGGALELIYPGERIDEKVALQFSRATAARIENVSVSFEGVDVGELAPSAPRALVDGEPWTVFGVYETPGVGRAIVRGKKAGEPFAMEVPLWLSSDATAPFVRRLWAKERVGELERTELTGRRAESMKTRIVEMCVEHRIASKYASFVVIEKRVGDRRTSTPAETRVVPVNLPAGWAMMKPQAQASSGGFAATTTMMRTRSYGAASPPPPPAARPMLGRPMPAGGAPAGRPAAPPPVTQSRGFVARAEASENSRASAKGSALSHDGNAPPEEADSSTAALMSKQGATGLWSEELGIEEACKATARILMTLHAQNIDTIHGVYGAQIRKAVSALLSHALTLSDEPARDFVLVATWLISGKRTRELIEERAARVGRSQLLVSDDTARAFLASAGV